MKENRDEFNTFGKVFLLNRMPTNILVRHVPLVLARNHRKLFLTHSSFNNTCNLQIKPRMQQPVNKIILSKKVIETSRLHLTYADVYKKCTTYGPSRWTASWTRSMDYPCGPRLIFEHEFDQRSKQIFGTLNGRKCGQFLLSVVWASYILNLSFLFSIPYQLNIMGSF